MRRDLIVLTLAATLVGAGAEAQPLRGAGAAGRGAAGGAVGQGGHLRFQPVRSGRAAIYDARGLHGRSGNVQGGDVRRGDLRGRRFAAYGGGFAGTAYAAPLGLYGTAGALEPGLVAEPYFKLPRPNELVPSAWGEGTYGIPTVSGIPPQPKADPVLYVINGGERPVGGARVILVQAPRR
ncbi:hypothetical protein DK419_26170 [Methylobacterium terrae]|uniref:Uncharacterized protein n=1 Tax=Methylobacterium terrae TaxID=2202827 RepID=A0A2U8WTK0_9HYPH|nr:hypothetical protein [Methylobacterium terrae]AWN49403.1 hypothetical protein DK419_26170 [Methylobacterium terrae]